MKSYLKCASFIFLTLLVSGCYMETKSSDCGLHDFDCGSLETMADTESFTDMASAKPAEASVLLNLRQRIKTLEQRVQRLENAPKN